MADVKAGFEYVVVELPQTPWKTRDRDMTAAINDVAVHGWRLVAIQPQYSAVAKAYGVFERPVTRG